MQITDYQTAWEILRWWYVQGAIGDTVSTLDGNIRKAGQVVLELRLSFMGFLFACVFVSFLYNLKKGYSESFGSKSKMSCLFTWISVGAFPKNRDISYIIILQLSKPWNLTLRWWYSTIFWYIIHIQNLSVMLIICWICFFPSLKSILELLIAISCHVSLASFSQSLSWPW